MTNIQATATILNIVNDLLQAGISGCTLHEARCRFDDLVSEFEENEDMEEDEETSHAFLFEMPSLDFLRVGISYD